MCPYLVFNGNQTIMYVKQNILQIKMRVLLIALVLVKLCFATDVETVKVQLEQGSLSGTVEKTLIKKQSYYTFRGIPYADPPTGKLRFKPPVAHTGWEETYEARENKPTCLQLSSRMRLGEPYGISGSEDCLYISVFTPDLKGSKPIVVFDYNDNFRTGFNGTETYAPVFFMEEDVIVVTISHRLGILGYLTSDDEVIKGNNGLRDFILGLEWIKDNIERFGGDPSRITIMGNRGGAVIANLLLYIKQARGLFSAVIMQSGSAYESIYFHPDPKRTALKLAELVNVTADNSIALLEGLQAADANVLLSHEAEVVYSEPLETYQMAVFPFSPVLEQDYRGALLSEYPEKSKIVNDVPVLIGFNSNEGLDLASPYLFRPGTVESQNEDFFFNFPIRPGFRFDINSSAYEYAIGEVRKFYFEDGIVQMKNIMEYANYISDALQVFATHTGAKKLSKELVSPVFYYVFDFYGMLNENTIYITRLAMAKLVNKGATVLDELCYLHLCSRILSKYTPLVKLDTKPADFKLLKKMVRMWTNFAKIGDPTPRKTVQDNILKDFTWPPVRKGTEGTNYLHITKNLKIEENPIGIREDFWNIFLEKYSRMADNDGVVRHNVARDEF
ncbi:esterase E4-like [Plodia interpunctella]|uniref:esterase E4-like n=1 Tax=Plodia interpunctella TaxID=58824 RepID=UPI00236800EA|nr:esterase E4-like [Plodia interpunctella]